LGCFFVRFGAGRFGEGGIKHAWPQGAAKVSSASFF
jgi:hypothetical protein